MRHRAIRAEMKAEIPFPFYRDSISLLQADKDGGPGEARWKARRNEYMYTSHIHMHMHMHIICIYAHDT